MVRLPATLPAAKELDLHEVSVLGYPDGRLDSVDPVAAQETIAEHLSGESRRGSTRAASGHRCGAVQCHRTQMSVYRNLEALPPEHHRALWGVQEFYRAYSLVNGGRARESDLFEGLR